MRAKRKPKVKLKCCHCSAEFVMFHCDILRTVETRGLYRRTCQKCGKLMNIKKTGAKFYCEAMPVVDRKLLKAKPTEAGYKCNIPDLKKYVAIHGFRGCLVNEPKFI